jgi:hypothetical protein
MHSKASTEEVQDFDTQERRYPSRIHSLKIQNVATRKPRRGERTNKY